MEKAKVSIIIPNYNRANFIGETLHSVLSQTYQNWEAIIVDDGSTDKSIEIIQGFVIKDKRIKYYSRHREPKGPSTCRNIGVEKSKGEYLIFLDSDDVLADFCLEQRIKFMIENTDFDFAVFKLELFNEKPGDVLTIFNKYPEKNDTYLKMFLRNELPWACPNPIWKKESFVNLGGFNEDLIIMEDPELHTRALLNGLKYEVLSNGIPDCYYRVNSFNSDKREYFYEMSIKGRMYYIKKIFLLIKSKSIDPNYRNTLNFNLRQAYISLLKGFYISRISIFKKNFTIDLIWCKENKLVTYCDYLIIKIWAWLWLNDYWFVKILRLKGLISQLLK
jgi:glycosyltransferase involved in cell wall biosynthesis